MSRAMGGSNATSDWLESRWKTFIPVAENFAHATQERERAVVAAARTGARIDADEVPEPVGE